MENEYNTILLPIITAVMLCYNRPVTLDEIADGVIALLSSQQEKITTMTSHNLECTSDSSYAKIAPAQRKRK
ncbi:hypothetical protein KR093_007616 [Drosophila rubida]|uniref:Uncharacterized protein n=1 Tax=Drosophila rubida TaxID=30044 RepID=A0AAD4K2Z1_9MUSC|nr:hypothetical protein KR093_007616 [Drosophila rubida]